MDSQSVTKMTFSENLKRRQLLVGHALCVNVKNVHTVFFIVAAVVATIIESLISAILSLFVGRFSPLTAKTVRLWSRFVMKVARVRVEVHGLENILTTTQYIVMSNHQSLLDLTTLLGYVPVQVTIIAKKELFRIPVFGWGIRGGGVLPVDRSNSVRAVETLKLVERILMERSLSLLIFPEGTRTQDGKLGSFKKGPFVVARNTGLPILPITIDGCFSVLPKTRWTLRPGTVHVWIHPPVSRERVLTSDLPGLIEDVRGVIASRLPSVARENQ